MKRKKYAYGGRAVNMRTPQEDLANYKRNNILANYEAQIAGEPLNHLGQILTNTGLNIASKGLGIAQKEALANGKELEGYARFITDQLPNITGGLNILNQFAEGGLVSKDIINKFSQNINNDMNKTEFFAALGGYAGDPPVKKKTLGSTYNDRDIDFTKKEYDEIMKNYKKMNSEQFEQYARDNFGYNATALRNDLGRARKKYGDLKDSWDLTYGWAGHRMWGTLRDWGNQIGDGLKDTFSFAEGGYIPDVPVEAEGGEVVETPDGYIKELFGPSHENGGINLDLPQGTEIYSDRLIGEDGKTMAERKKARELKLQTLQKKLDKTPTNKLLRRTVDRLKKENEMLDKKDLAYMEQARVANGKYATGGYIKPYPTGRKYADDIIKAGLFNYEDEKPNFFYKGAPRTFIRDYEEAHKYPYTSNTPLSINPDNYASDNSDKTPIDSYTPQVYNGSLDNSSFWNKAKEYGKKVKDSTLGDLSLGDAIGLYANYHGPRELYKNTLEQYSNTPTEKNWFENYGQNALNKLQEQYAHLDNIKNDHLQDLELSRRAAYDRNNQSARSINAARALNLATDAQLNNAYRDIYGDYANRVADIGARESAMLADIDRNVMQGEDRRAERELQNMDNFYSNMARNISDKYKAQGLLGRSINDVQERRDNYNLMNQMFSDFGYNPISKELVAKEDKTNNYKTKVSKPELKRMGNKKTSQESKSLEEQVSEANARLGLMENKTESKKTTVQKKNKEEISQNRKINTPVINLSIEDRIHNSESKYAGSYKATNGNALGKYQHMWSVHNKEIEKITGVNNKEDYLNNPKAQEKYQSHLLKQHYAAAKKWLSKAREIYPDITLDDLAMINHFQPATLVKFAQGRVDLDYVPPAGKGKKNRSLGAYLYGDLYKGVKRG